jgi:hypothetical protein
MNSLRTKTFCVTCSRLLLVAGVVLTSEVQWVDAYQQPHSTSREIISDDFVKNRKKATHSKSATTKVGQGDSESATARNRNNRKRYRLASSSLKKPPKPTTGNVVEQLGVTLWRLSPAKPKDQGARMLVMEGGESSEWVPKRIEADTPLSVGDRVRLTIESPRAGFLYIVDRDLFADGTMGDGMLIFPTFGTRGGDNQVRAGKLIDIPAQDDRQNYFTAKPVRSDQVGEVLSIIVTTSQLDLPISNKPLKLSSLEIGRWEKAWAATADRFEMANGIGSPWTEKEKQAAASTGARQLTQDEPTPQTIYRLDVRTGDAFLVNVVLRYGR